MDLKRLRAYLATCYLYTNDVENSTVIELIDALEKANAFKAYVHTRLDEMGVPHSDPESEHDKAGCRVGGRLDLLEEERSRAFYALSRLSSGMGNPAVKSFVSIEMGLVELALERMKIKA